ncbi:MAG: lysozyme inhibitor LprI family protein [Paracoccaceae bacterium]
MKTLATAATLAVFGATGAFAQDLVYSDTHTASCLDVGTNAQEKSACIGVSANACMEDTEGGFSTVGIGGCLLRELDYWDASLNANYRALMAEMKKQDADNAGYGVTGVQKMADALRAMQRAWIAFRDTSCDFERAKFSNGTGAGPAQLGCLMQMTAERALFLQSAGEVQ